jgi:hypothetical protein
MLADRALAIHRVCFDSEPSKADLTALGSPERWLVYRELVRSRLGGVIEAALPRAKHAIGEDAFQRLVDEWLSAGGPTTRYYRHVPNELASFAIPTLEDAEAPWAADLMRYEIASWSVRHAPPDPTPEAELAFDRQPVVGSAVKLLRLDYPVHESPTPAAGYRAVPTALCLHRNEAHRAVPRVLNPLAADLLEAWQRGEETVAEAVERVAATHGTEIGPAFVEKLSALIASFIEQGILLGGRHAQ